MRKRHRARRRTTSRALRTALSAATALAVALTVAIVPTAAASPRTAGGTATQATSDATDPDLTTFAKGDVALVFPQEGDGIVWARESMYGEAFFGGIPLAGSIEIGSGLGIGGIAPPRCPNVASLNDDRVVSNAPGDMRDCAPSGEASWDRSNGARYFFGGRWGGFSRFLGYDAFNNGWNKVTIGPSSGSSWVSGGNAATVNFETYAEAATTLWMEPYKQPVGRPGVSVFTGTATPKTQVTVTVGGIALAPVTVDQAGYWSVQVPAEVRKQLPETGRITVQAEQTTALARYDESICSLLDAARDRCDPYDAVVEYHSRPDAATGQIDLVEDDGFRFTAPAEGSFVSPGADLTVAGTVGPWPGSIVYRELAVTLEAPDGSSHQVYKDYIMRGTLVEDGTRSWSWTVPGTRLRDPGQYTLTAVLDGFDPVSTNVTVLGPIVIEAPEAGTVLPAGTSGVTVSGTATPGTRLKVVLRDQVTRYVYSGSDGSWRTSFGVVNGFFAVVASYADYPDSDISARTTFSIAQGPLEFSSPLPGARYPVGKPVPFSGAVSAVTPVAVTFTLRGPDGSTKSIGSRTPDATTGSWSGSVGAVYQSGPGVYTLTASYLAVSASVEFVMYEERAVDLVAPRDGGWASATPLVSGRGTVGEEIAVSVDGLEVGRATVNDHGGWLLRVVEPLAAGSHTITATQGSDGSTATATVAVTPAQVGGQGRDGDGQVTGVPADLADVVEVDGGAAYSLALRADGTVAAWGSDAYGQVSGVPDRADVVQVSAGAEFALALHADGTVSAWGRSEYGQVRVPAGLSDVVQVSAGQHFALALRADGTVVAWGRDNHGQVADAAALDGVVQVAAGYYLAVALHADGTVTSWGEDQWARTQPELSGITQIAAGGGTGYALDSAGTITAWGQDDYGQTAIPSGVASARPVGVAAGDEFAVALRADGSVDAWGRDDDGRTGVAGWAGASGVGAGSHHSLVLRTLGVTITSPADGQDVPRRPEITGTSELHDGLVTVTATVEGGEPVTVGSTEVDSDGLWTLPHPDALPTGQVTLTATHPSGAHHAITVRVVDTPTAELRVTASVQVTDRLPGR